jgi:hypothetical protein
MMCVHFAIFTTLTVDLSSSVTFSPLTLVFFILLKLDKIIREHTHTHF